MSARTLVLAAIAALVVSPSVGQSQTRDHLKCYQVKDTALKATYTGDLDGLLPDTGCQIKVPAVMLCVDTRKTNVTPAPPGARSPGAAKRYACCKVKCPKNATTPPVVQFKDQFANRPMQPKVAKLVCAPEEGTGATAPACTGSPGSSCACGTGTGACVPYSGGTGCFVGVPLGSCTTDANCSAGAFCITGAGVCAAPCP